MQGLTPSYQARGRERSVAKEEAYVTGPEWIAEGRELLYTTRNQSPLHRVSISPGAKPRTVPGVNDQLEITSLSSTGTGTVIAQVSQHDAAFWRMDLLSQTPHFEKLQSIPYTDNPRFRVSNDGRRVVFVSRGALWTSDLSGANVRLVTKHSEDILNPRWSPDGRLIAFIGDPAEGNADLRSRLYVVSAEGGKPRRLLPSLDDVSFSSWSRDGKWLVRISRERGPSKH